MPTAASATNDNLAAAPLRTLMPAVAAQNVNAVAACLSIR